MKNITIGRHLLLVTALGLLFSFGCAKKDQVLDSNLLATERAPESIKLEISLKDERQKTSHISSAEEAPKAPTVAKKNCTPRVQGNSASTAPWSNIMGGQNNTQWPTGMNGKANAPWGQNNTQWPQMGQMGMNGAQQQWPQMGGQNMRPAQWPTSANSAPSITTTVVEAADDCVDPGFAAAPGMPGPAGPGPAAPFGYPSPYYNPYGPYFVADIIADDDGFRRRHHNSSDDDNFSDDDYFSDDDSHVNDDDF